MNRRTSILAIAALLATTALVATPGHAADKVRAAKSVDVAWAFIPLDVGIEEGIFAKYNLDVDASAMTGDAKLQQALTSDSIDFGMGSGPSMAFAVKGSPVLAVAAFAAEPRNISVVVPDDSPIKTVADLKGKLLAVTTAGSLTEWLVKRIGVQEGWGPDAVKTIALGPFEAFMAAQRTHQIDGMMVATEKGYQLEETHDGHILVGMEKYAPKFHTHVIFATNKIRAANPDIVNRFLKGFFASVAFMKANKEKTTEIAMKVLNQSAGAMNKTYDYEISMLENDGHFDPAAVDVIKESFVEMGVLPTKPENDQLFTTQFLPVKP